MKLSRLFQEFFSSEKAGGFILILVTIVSLFLANSSFQSVYTGFWDKDIGGHSIIHWINDGLMSVFFLLIGLELEREIYAGELSNIKKASLPIFAALGGMVAPAGIYLLLNYGTETQSGAGITTATDIAFAIGVLSLLGKRVPNSLKIFLTALAVIDDLGAIIIISIFYTDSLVLMNLIIALGIFLILILLNRLKVYIFFPYIIGGVIMWYFMQQSGVHPTISGVLLAFAIPFSGDGGEKSLSFRLQHSLHKPVAFMILPLFALANTAIALDSTFLAGLTQASGIGIMLGLIIGKPTGIFLFSFAAVKSGFSELPYGMKWTSLLGIGLLGGIGFTMSIFISLLAFGDVQLVNNSKAAILIASSIAGTAGYLSLKTVLKKPVDEDSV